jgi:hypothetical protein
MNSQIRSNRSTVLRLIASGRRAALLRSSRSNRFRIAAQFVKVPNLRKRLERFELFERLELLSKIPLHFPQQPQVQHP